MRVRVLAPLLGACLVGALVAPVTAGARPPAVNVPELPVDVHGDSRAIVAFGGAVLPEDAEGILDEVGVTRGLELPSIGAVAVSAPLAAIEALAEVPGVMAIEPQRQLQLDLYASRAQVNADGIGEPTGGSQPVPGVTGDGVTVAVLDSGIFADHPDFGPRVVSGLHFAFSEIQDTGGIAYEDWDAYVEATGPIALQDEIGHGTHVAGTVGGDGSLSASAGGVDLAGIAPGVEFVSMKVADAPFGIVDDIDWEEAALAAFDYIIRHPELGVDIAQNSWGLLPTEPNCSGLDCGEPTDFDAMAEMIGAVEDAGVNVVFSAGNAGPEPGTIGGYHRADQAILVGAACKSTDNTDEACLEDAAITSFSSRGVEDGSGPQIDVVAPGENIMAPVSPSVLLPLTQCPDTAEVGYYCISGTSMASPHVSGVVALMLEATPELTPTAVKQCLYTTAVDLLEPGVDMDSGHGMVDARAAVRCGIEAAVSSLAPLPGGLVRIDGDDRMTTAIETSGASYPDGSVAAVLARADAFPDGLAGTPLAVALGAPMLLTPADSLDPRVADELDRLLPEGARVVLLGGPGALSTEVGDAVRDAGFLVERIGGDTRHDTAIAIADRVAQIAPLSSVLLARGDEFPDALAAGPGAVAASGAVLLTDGANPHAATQAWLDDHDGLEVYAVGGAAAAAHPSAVALVGTDREATAVAVAEALLGDATGTGIARRDVFADALAGGVHAAGHGLPILLTGRDVLSAPTAGWLDAVSPNDAVIYGGTGAVSSAVEDAVAARLG